MTAAFFQNSDVHTQASDRAVFVESIEGVRGNDQKRIAEKVLDLGSTLLRKNADYGSSVWKTPVLAPNLPPRSAILVRMSDKVSRLERLLAGNEAEVKSESIEDTMKDLVAYGILWLAAPVEETKS